MTKHQQKTEDTRRKLLKAALKIFARDGFEASRIDDIAREAGFTRGAFYAQFSDKEDLFFALLLEQAESKCTTLVHRLQRCLTDEEKIDTLRQAYVEKFEDKRWSILLLEFKLHTLRHPKIRARYVEEHRRIRQSIHLSQIAPLLPNDANFESSEWQAIRAGLEALVTGLALQQRYDADTLPTDAAERVLSRCFNALVPSRTDPS